MASAVDSPIDDARARLAAIVEAADDAIIGTAPNGIVFAWNNAAERMLGYTAREMIGQPLAIITPPDRIEEEASTLGQFARRERIDHYETLRRRKDGRIIRASVTVSPIREGSGRIIGIERSLRDLTDRDASKQRIRELETQLAHKRRLTDLGQVVSALVHEVNQPMTAIANYLVACRRLAAAGELARVRTALERMEDQTRRASAIIRRIRDFAMHPDYVTKLRQDIE